MDTCRSVFERVYELNLPFFCFRVKKINKPVVSVDLDEFATNVSGASDSVKQSGGSQV